MVFAVAAALLASLPGTAAADPATPTNWISEVTAVRPSVDGVEVRVTGGDAFLELSVQPGHHVEVLSDGGTPHGGRPFLRVERDGNVLADLRSPAYHRSLDRHGRTPIPDEASPDAEPRWEIIGRGGTHAWHDHRIHHTDPSAGGAEPSGSDGARTIERWEVPMVVDSEAVTVHGELRWFPSSSPWPAAAVAIVFAGLVVVAHRRVGWPASVAAALIASVLVVSVAGAELSAIAGPEPASPFPVVVTASASLLALAAGALYQRRPDEAEPLAFLAAGAATVFAATRFVDVLRPFVPSELPVVAVRYGLAAALGMGAAVMVSFVFDRRLS